MEKEKKVSVILPNYNNGHYIEKAIKSVLNQTYKNLELIIIDDASNDNSREIINKYSSDERVKIILQNINRHVAYSVNLGFQKADGEYIARIDSDDWWEETKLQKQVEFMEENTECGACFTRIHIVDDESKIADEKFWLLCGLYNQEANKTQKGWAEYFLNVGNCLCNPSVLIRKSALDIIGNYYNIAYVPAQDFEMWTRMIKKFPIYIIEEKLTYYRWTEEENKISGMGEESRQAFFNVHMIVRYNFLSQMDNYDLINLFKDNFINSQACSHEELECEKAFLLEKCVTNSKNINFLGLLQFEKILNSESGLNILEDKYDFNLKSYYKKYRNHNFYDSYDIDNRNRMELNLSEQNERIERLENSLEFIKNELNQNLTELDRIKNSRSWKLTKPLRYLKKMVGIKLR